jgi:erythromycin esterase-like protein
MKTVTRIAAIFLVAFLLVLGCRKNQAAKTAGGESIAAIPYHPLATAKDLDLLIQQIGNARVVLLGEASHGTSEYYRWRDVITRRLIAEKGFDFIGVEGEWADSYRVNRFVKGPAADSLAAVNVLRNYDRWPTWMWGNHEVASLITWMNQFNQERPGSEKVGFFGLDVYCLWESMTELMPYIQDNDSLRKLAVQVQQCFQPYSADVQDYGYAVANASASCVAQTERLYRSIMNYTGNATAKNEPQFVMQQNALVAFNAEKYFRSSVTSYEQSWNIRDGHMMETITRLLEMHGPESKMIIWEHNTHVGDARYTDMAGEGMVNVGQLVREAYGEDKVYIVGFGSYEGTVIASRNWGGAIQKMNVPAAPAGSWEALLHQVSTDNKLLLSSELKGITTVQKNIGHRAIGVVYNPSREQGNYVPSVLPRRYDAFIYLDKTTALHPLGTTPRNEPGDTYPSGY